MLDLQMRETCEATTTAPIGPFGRFSAKVMAGETERSTVRSQENHWELMIAWVPKMQMTWGVEAVASESETNIKDMGTGCWLMSKLG